MKIYIFKFCEGSFLILALMGAQPMFAAAQTSAAPPQLQEVNQGTTSPSWAGYVAHSGTYTSVSGSWVVPSVSAATALAGRPWQGDSTWVGIGGLEGQGLIQAGTREIEYGTTTTYNAWVETLPRLSKTVPLSVAPGDSISASLVEQPASQQSMPAGRWLVTIKNRTTGQQYQTTLTYSPSLSSAEWIEEMLSIGNNIFLPIDAFGSVAFTGGSTSVNGESKTIAQSGAHPLQMINTQDQVLVTTAALGPDGASFSVARTSALPTVAATSTGAAPLPTAVYRQAASGGGFVHYQLDLLKGFILRFMQMR